MVKNIKLVLVEITFLRRNIHTIEIRTCCIKTYVYNEILEEEGNRTSILNSCLRVAARSGLPLDCKIEEKQ